MKETRNKKYILLLFFSVITLMGVMGVQAQSKPSKLEKKARKEQQVRELIESGNYKIEVSTAYPLRGKVVHLSSAYSIEVRNDSIISSLPYYGRAYSIPYGGGQGLMFQAPLSAYRVKTLKKKEIELTLNAQTSEDRYEFSIRVYTNATANVEVTMQQRQSIRFAGTLLLPFENGQSDVVLHGEISD